MEVFCILIYCLTNKINNKKYVGQTNNLKRRMNEHKSTSFNPKSCSYNDLIHKKIREYGWDNFSIEVLEDNIPPELINIREIKKKGKLIHCINGIKVMMTTVY